MNSHAADIAKELNKEIWRVLEYVRGASDKAEYHSLASALLLIKFLQTKYDPPIEEHYKGTPATIEQYIHQLIESLSRDIEISIPTESLTLLRDELSRYTLNSNVANDSSQIIWIFIRSRPYAVSQQIAQLAHAELLENFSDNESKSGSQFFTPNDLNQLLYELGTKNINKINKYKISICDPFAGGGGTAFKFIENNKIININTQENNRRAFIQTIISRIIHSALGRDYFDDSISNPLYKTEKYDLIVSNPPFGLRISSARKEHALYTSKIDTYYNFAKNLPETRSDWLLILGMLGAVNFDGELITTCTVGALLRSGVEADIRKYIVDSGSLKSVILLPQGLFHATKIPSAILILQKPAKNQLEHINIIDASLLYTPGRKRNKLEKWHIKEICNSISSKTKYNKLVTPQELQDNNYNLNPQRYIKKTLNISQITIQNFRGYKHYTVSLHPKLTILVGENGAGKTSILEAISCALGPFLTSIPDAKGKTIKKSDIRIAGNTVADFCKVTIETFSNLSWDVIIKGAEKSNVPSIGYASLSAYAKNLIEEDAPLPLIAYFGTNRTVSTPGKIAFDPFEVSTRAEGYENALDAKNNYLSIKSWFSKIEIDELILKDSNKSFAQTHPAKRILTRAIKQVIGNIKNIQFDKVERDVKVEWHQNDHPSTSLTLEQLSEGYRSMVTLIIDLVRRAFKLNPQLSDPLSVDGIVLIDEIELHLHPRWQQKVIGDLCTLFPNIQFVVTTHSPQVLTTVRGESIRTISCQESHAGMVDSPYGAESGRVMEEILGVLQRPTTEVSTKLKQYFELIEAGHGTEQKAKNLKLDIQKLTDGNEPMLHKAELAIKRVNWLKNRGKI